MKNVKKNSLLADETDITSILEYAKKKMLVACSGTPLLIVEDWKSIRTIKEPSLVDNDKYWLSTMPGFDVEKFPYCISHGSPTFNLINIKLGTNEILVKAPEKHYYAQQAACFRFEGGPHDEHYPASLHFATKTFFKDSSRLENWHSLAFTKEFKSLLDESQELPKSSKQQQREIKKLNERVTA